MTIIGIDQSTLSTAYSVLKDGELIDYGLIKPKSSKRATEVTIKEEPHLIAITMPEEQFDTTLLRTSYICDVTKELIKKVNPDRVAFEEIYVAPSYNPITKRVDYSRVNISGFRSLGRLQGQLSRILWEMEMPYDIYLETTWITAFGTYGKNVKREERKADVMAKVNAMYGLDITIDDISDAIGIAYYAAQNN